MAAEEVNTNFLYLTLPPSLILGWPVRCCVDCISIPMSCRLALDGIEQIGLLFYYLLTKAVTKANLFKFLLSCTGNKGPLRIPRMLTAHQKYSWLQYKSNTIYWINQGWQGTCHPSSANVQAGSKNLFCSANNAAIFLDFWVTKGHFEGDLKQTARGFFNLSYHRQQQDEGSAFLPSKPPAATMNEVSSC